MKTLLMSVTAAAALVAGPAIAADMPVKGPRVAAPLYSWTGCYLGIHAGGKWGESEHVEIGTGHSTAGSFHVNGVLSGGQLGCNWQTNNFVLGVEGDGSWVHARGGHSDIAPFFNTGFRSQTEEKWLATVRGRAGIVVNPTTLLYVTGGVAFASVKAGAFQISNPANNVFETNTMTGWTAGGGAEWTIGGPLTVKVEYLYVDLGTDAFNDPPVGCCVARDVSLRQHIGRVGLNYRF